MASADQTKIKPLPIRKHTGGAREGNKHAQTHGLTVLKHAVNGLGNRLVDKRTVTGKALAKWRTDLIQDLGGAGRYGRVSSSLSASPAAYGT